MRTADNGALRRSGYSLVCLRKFSGLEMGRTAEVLRSPYTKTPWQRKNSSTLSAEVHACLEPSDGEPHDFLGLLILMTHLDTEELADLRLEYADHWGEPLAKALRTHATHGLWRKFASIFMRFIYRV